MQAQNSASISGEEELRQVAQRCLDSPETHLFVVGPSRSGKSTRLPVLLSALSGMKVICVQPDDRVAQYHAEWVQANVAEVCTDKNIRVGYYKDEDDIEFHFVPNYDVTYVSSRWLYRLVVGVTFNESRLFIDDVNMCQQRKEHRDDLAYYRRKYKLGKPIGYVLLDEMHAQSVVQELGYMATHAAISGLVEAPIGFFDGTKVIYTTAYPENDTFLGCFDLSKEEIEKRVIKIDTGLAPAPGMEILERFIAEDQKQPPEDYDYHVGAVQKAQEILKSNKEARILLLMDTMYSKRNITRQNPYLRKMVKVLDLETDDGWNMISGHNQGPIVILATPNFASRIPVQGITDVICPPFQFRPVVSKKLHREVFLEVLLAKWELSWVKSHLDPSLKQGTIHCIFKSSLHSRLKDICGARLRSGDFIDITLGLIRLCCENALGARSPRRFPIPLITAERAFRQLEVTPSIIAKGFDSTEMVTRLIMSPQSRSPIMTRLMDHCGLDRRHAFFLGFLQQKMEDCEGKFRIKNDHQNFLTMVAVAMVVFDDNPILRVKSRRDPKTETMATHFRHLLDFFHLGHQEEATSDSWINAVVWLDIKRRAIAAGSDITKFARGHFKSKQFLIDQVPLEAAESKLRFLARMTGLDERSQNALCDGSFLKEVEEFQNFDVFGRINAAMALWQSYFYAFQFNLVHVTIEEESAKVVDVPNGIEVKYDWNHLVVNLFEQARAKVAVETGGFYGTFTTRTFYGYRTLTIIPIDILCNVVEDSDGSKGAFDLRSLLSLE